MMSNRRPAILDVATEAGVSRAAVSKVIRDAYGVSPAMRERVEAAIERLGYRPRVAARSMRGQSFTIGIGIPQLGTDFFSQVLEGASERIADSDYGLIIAPSVDGAAALDSLIDRQVDGIIANLDVSSGVLEELGTTLPVVLLGRHDASISYDTITNDDAAGVQQVMTHLFELGHKRIAHLTLESAADSEHALSPHGVRLAEYIAIMASKGLDPEVVLCSPADLDGYLAAGTLLRSATAPTAIFAGNDTLAVGTLRATGELGLGSSEVSVVGYDNIKLASHPLMSITTVDQYGVEMGRTAIDLLLGRVRGSVTEARHHQFEPVLRPRGSSTTALNSM